jgi:hypothetical protein
VSAELDRTPRPPLTIRAGARPFETTVMLGGLIAGIAGVFDVQARSRVIISAFGDGTVLWYLSLVLWCGLVLASIVPQGVAAARRGWSTLVHPRGEEKLAARLIIEAAGMVGFSGSAVAYGIAALAYTGQSASTAAVWIGLFGAAALWRAGEIFVDLRKLNDARDHPMPAYPIPLGDPRGSKR